MAQVKSEPTLVEDANRPQADRWMWNCPRQHKRWIVPGMTGLPSRHRAAHFFAGRERAVVRGTGHGEAVAIVRGVDGQGPARLQLYKMRGKWFVNQIVVCQKERRSWRKPHDKP